MLSRMLILGLILAGLTACGPGKKPEREKPAPTTEEEKINHELDELVKAHAGWVVADRGVGRIPKIGETAWGKLIVNKGFYRVFVRGGDVEVIIVRP